MNSVPDTPDGRLTYSVDEVVRLLGVSRAAVYEAARSGKLPTVRIGRRILVPRIALERWLSAAT